MRQSAKLELSIQRSWAIKPIILRSHSNGIVKRHQWNCSTKSMELFNEINGFVSWKWWFGLAQLANWWTETDAAFNEWTEITIVIIISIWTNVVYILNTETQRRRGLVQREKGSVPPSLCVQFNHSRYVWLVTYKFFAVKNWNYNNYGDFCPSSMARFGLIFESSRKKLGKNLVVCRKRRTFAPLFRRKGV